MKSISKCYGFFDIHSTTKTETFKKGMTLNNLYAYL